MKCKVKRDVDGRFIDVINPETQKTDSLYKSILAKVTKDPESYIAADDFIRGLYSNNVLLDRTKEEVALGIWAKVHQYWINTGTSPVERVVEAPIKQAEAKVSVKPTTQSTEQTPTKVSPEPIKTTVKEIKSYRPDIFEFSDGISIKTPFKLNSQQEEALQKMADFLNSKNSFFTLKGYAGTGKTSIIKILAEYDRKSRGSNIIFSSPTHRANAVLKLSLKDYSVSTLHKIFGLSPVLDLENFSAKDAEFSQQNTIKIGYGDILIIDESSMINDNLLDFIKKSSDKLGIKVLFMGDPAQIKPVKQTHISKVFTEFTDQYELTKVERTGDNPLLAEVTDVRNGKVSEDQFSYNSIQNTEGEGVTYTNSQKTFFDKLSELFTSEEAKSNPLLARVVSGTNANVDEMNNRIRKAIYGSEAINEYNKGELLMGYSNFDTNYVTGESLVINSGDYIVEDISQLLSSKFAGKDVKYFELTLKNAINPEEDSFTIKMLSKTNTQDVFNAIGAEFEKIRQRAINAQTKQAKAIVWKELNEFGRQYATPKPITNGTDNFGKPAVKIGKTLDYGYAHTIHKSQGGTYKYIFIDSRDLTKFPDFELRKQLRYVALSRAQTHAYILTDKDITTSTQSTEDFEVQETLSDDIILPIKMSEIRPDKPKNEVQYEYEAVKILQSTKASEIFTKGKKNNWSLDKILHELQIPKEQKQLILELGITDREQIVIELVANYSFTVEINTAISDAAQMDFNNLDELGTFKPTHYYSNLTVPGGTNYIENEISTPLITPSIKGHAQFATSNGIGWFRSDDKENKVVGWKEENDFLNSETAQYNPITKDDRVIFGHPTIGKSYLKQKGSNDFITLDDDYANEVNAFIDANRGTETRQEYKGRKPKEYNEFMLNLFDRLKAQAKKEGKRLFVSNTNILKERMSEFDKVITIPKDEFKKRFDARGATYGFEDWKSDIDATVAKVDKSKVISTTGYLSDLLEGNPKTRRILEVQSDLFQKGRDKEFLVDNYKHTPGDRNFNVTYEGKEYKVGTMGGMQRVVIYKTLKGQVHYENPKQDWLTQEEIPQGLKDIVSNKFNSLKQEVLTQNKSNKENQFLQLLNKDSNWVTFFIKSIIQDSAKKGYEKVLFPSGNTASKVEGHTTLEDFKKQKEDRIKALEDIILNKSQLLTEFRENDDVYLNYHGFKSDYDFVRIRQNYWNRMYKNDDLRTLSGDSYDGYVIQEYTNGKPNKITKISKEKALELIEKSDKGVYNENLERNKNEIVQLKQELERVETEGFGALKPIYNFYENTVTNILKKIDRIKKITDEYGNTWNEISIDPIEGFDDIILPKIEESVNQIFTEYDDYIDGFESFQTFDKINEQIKSNIKFYDSRMATLKAEKSRLKAGDSVRNEKIKKELASYENKKSAAEAELKKAQTLDGVSGLEAFAANQLDEFERLIESDSALDVLDYVNTNIRFWRAVGDTDPTRQHILYAKEELFPEIMERLSIIGARAIVLENTLAKKRLEATQTLMEEKLAGDKSTFWGELQNTSDINFWQQQALDLSAYGDSVLTLVQVLEKDAVSRAQLVIAELIQKFEAAYEPVKDKLGNNYEVLIQKYADGTPTNRLLYRFSPEFFTESKEARSRFENNPTNKKYEEFAKWITENEILMNPIILFPTKLGDDYHWGQSENMYSDYEESMRQKHIDELKATLGEKDYEMYITRMKEKIERFTFQYNEEKRRLDGTALTAEEKEYALKDWELENSPYYWAQKVLNGKTLENSKGVTVRNVGYKFAESIPRRFKPDGSETGFYDKNYERIQNDPQLAAFYDELLDITSSLADMLPSDKRRELGVNGLPFLRKEITELFSKGNFVGMTKELFDQYIEMTRTKDFGNIDLSERDPLTGRKKFKAGLHLDTGEQAIKDLAQAKMVNYELTNAADLKTMSVAERAILKDHLMLQFRKEATAELQKDRSEDLVTTMKAYILATVMYRHKAAIENTLNAVAEVAERRNAFVIKDGKIQTHDDGSPVLAGHAKKKIEAANFNIEAFLTGRTRKTQGKTKKKVLTNPEKTRKESLDKLLLSAEEKYAAGEISLDAYNRHKEVIEEQLNNLGGVKESSKYGDLALRFVQLKGLGWNILSSINNITFGYVANSTEAAAGEFFNDYNLSTARKMLTSSMLTNASFNHWRDAKSKKIRKMIELYDILKDASTELYKSSNRSPIMSRFRFLNPFQLTKRTEYLNQGQTFIAFMLHEKIKDLQGNEVSLWEAFDTNGTWKTEEFGEMDLNRFSHTKTSVDQLIKRIHGNYDELSPLMGKSDIWGRALFQFKTWFPETLRKYFGKETPDHILGDMYKGRYRTLWDVFTADENKASTLGALLTEFLRKYLNVTSFGLIKNFSDENAFNALSKVDMLNMKRNIHQFIFIVNLNMMYYVIKYMADDDDDDKVFNATMNIALHQVSRLTGELELYSSPTQLSEFTKNLIPVTVIVRDLNDIMKAISKTISGDYYMQSGSYEGWYRPIKELGEAIPLVAPGMRYYSIGTGQSQSKEATLIEAVVGE